jgi:hypothetical protein
MSKKGEELEWVRVAEEFEASGLTQREFAEQRGLVLSTLQSWIYRRRRQVSRAGTEPVRLLPVQVSAASSSAGSLIEVLTSSGARVRFAVGTDVEYLARLMAAVSR